MDITAAIARLQYHWNQIEGLGPDHAPPEPRDKVDVPIVLTYDATSETDISVSYADTFAPQDGTLRSDLMLSRTNPDLSIPLARKMKNAFLLRLKADPNLNGALMITSRVRATFMTFDLGGMVYIGYRVEFDYTSELTG